MLSAHRVRATLVAVVLLACAPLPASGATLAELAARLPSTSGRERVDLLNELAQESWSVSSADTIRYGEQARDLARELGYPTGEAAGLRNIAIGHWYADDLDGALDLALQALTIYEQLRDPAGIAGTKSTIGTIYMNLDRLEEARATYLQALAIAEGIGDENRIGIILSNLGTVNLGLERLREALGYFEKALPILKRQGSELSVLTCLANIAGGHRRLGEHAEARDINLRVLELATQLGSTARRADALSDLGECEAVLGRPELGRDYLRQAVTLAAKEGLKRTEQEAEEASARLEERAGNYAAALAHQRRYGELRDAIFSEESKQAVADLEVKYETGEKERQNAIQRLELERQSNLRNGLLGALALLTVMAGVNHARYRAKRRAGEALAALAEVNERLARMQDTATLAVSDAATWAERTAEEVARTLGARAIAVFSLEGDRLQSLGVTATAPPTLAALDRACHQAVAFGAPVVLVPLQGMGGRAFGALVVEGKEVWSDAERRLITGFANQLGSTLELRHLREVLDASALRRSAAREELVARGEGVLHVCPTCHRCFDETVARCPDDGSAPKEDARLLPYRLLSRYVLTEVLGAGGMGVVFAARDERLQREVALKVIRAEQAQSARARIRFEQEARVLAQVAHPNVIAIHDSGELVDGSLYLIMERLHGRTCRQLLTDLGRPPRDLAALVLEQGAAALDACHDRGLVHRDVKPENLFVVEATGVPEVRLLDFGLARELGDLQHLTATGAVVGTPAYMSPEQIQGRKLDAASDVYSFAAVGYELVTGERWLPGRDLGEIMTAMFSPVRPRLETALVGVPPVVLEAFALALAVEPALRPQRLADWVAGFAGTLAASVPEQEGSAPADAPRRSAAPWLPTTRHG